MQIREKCLQPYRAYGFSWTVTSPQKQEMTDVTIYITELSLPALDITLPKNILVRKVNINEQIKIKVNY